MLSPIRGTLTGREDEARRHDQWVTNVILLIAGQIPAAIHAVGITYGKLRGLFYSFTNVNTSLSFTFTKYIPEAK